MERDELEKVETRPKWRKVRSVGEERETRHDRERRKQGPSRKRTGGDRRQLVREGEAPSLSRPLQSSGGEREGKWPPRVQV